MITMKRRSLFTYLGLCLSTLLLLVSCNRTEVQPNPAQTSTTENISVGFSIWPGWLPWQVAIENDILTTHKSKAQFQWFEQYLDSLKALQEGKIQANSQSLNDTIAAISNGADQVVVLVNDNSTGNDKVIVRAGINSVADLKGKKIAVETGTVDHFLLALGLHRAGIPLGDVTLVSLETSKAAAAFAAGEVDATAVFAPFTSDALKRQGSKELFSSKDYPGTVVDVLAVNRSTMNEHPEQVQALVDSWFNTLAHMKRNPTQSMTVQAKRAGVSVTEYQQYANGTKIFGLEDNLKALYPALGNQHSIAGMAVEINKFMMNAGLTTNLPDIDGLIDDRFVKAYAAKHQKSAS
jgi:NitT/TauT family transport system substrate-binding protein